MNCSLRSAIIAANNNPGPDEISLPQGTYNIALAPGASPSDSNGDFDITDSLTITGTPSDPTLTVIDALQLDRVFSIVPSSLPGATPPITAVLNGLTIQGGLSPRGIPGGGIDAASDTNVELRHTIVRNNRVDTSLGNLGDADGGGIATSGNLLLENANISSNSAGANGGAIAMFGSGTLSITDAAMSNNTAGFDGAGIWAGNSANYQITVSRTTIQGNRSTGREGGGVWIEGDITNASVIFNDVSFINNEASMAAGGAALLGLASFSQTGGTYDQNTTSDGSGGGLLIADIMSSVIDGTTFTNNVADDGGGGAAVFTDAIFRNTLFQQNRVTGAPSPGELRFDLGGGGIAIAQGTANRPSIRIEDSSILDNTAALAGGIGAANSNVEIVNSTIENNESTGTFGGGGGIGFAQDDVMGISGNRVRLTISNSRILSNISASEGGGIGVADADAELIDTTVSGNVANEGRAGGIGLIGFNNSPSLRLNRVTVDNNRATSDGGGIAIRDGGFFFTNTTISDNVADGNGGGVAFANADTSVSGSVEFSTIASNTTNGFGANVAVNGSVTRFLSSIIANPLGNTPTPVRNFVSGGPGELSSQGFNLVSDLSSSFAAATDIINVDPLIGSLADNGGLIRTRALLPGSPAIDAGAGAPLAVDARNQLRPFDGDGNGVAVNDIGAFESQVLSIVNNLAIEGLVFVDEGDVGLDDNDMRLTGVEVRLLQDGGDGVFGGDDTLVDTIMTAFSPDAGKYRFENLSPGLYFVLQLPASDPSGLIAPGPVSVTLDDNTQTTLRIIDSFDQTGFATLITSSTSPIVEDSATAVEAIGGERDYELSQTSGTGSVRLSIAPALFAALDLGGVNGSGTALLQYDGLDDSLALSATGLGGVNLSDFQSDAGIYLTLQTDILGGGMSLFVHSSATAFSVASASFPVNAITGFVDVFVPFSAFTSGGPGGPADFTNVGAIEIFLDVDASQNLAVTSIRTGRAGVATVNLANVASAVSAVDDTISTDEDASVTIDVLANDTTNSGSLRIVSTVPPTNGTAIIDNDQIVYTPDEDYFGTDVFTYEITNAAIGESGPTATAQVTVTVVPVNDPPIAADDALDVPNFNPFIIPLTSLLANDRPGPANELTQTLTVTSVTQPAVGQVVLNNADITFTPPATFAGATSFTYTVTDEDGLTDTATVFLSAPPAPALSDVAVNLSGPATVLPGAQITYTIQITNNGPSTATGVQLVDVLPAGTTFVSGITGSGTTVTATNNTVTLPLGSLDVFSTETVTLVVALSSFASGTITNTVTVTAQEDTNVTNNTATLSTTILPAAGPAIHTLTTGNQDGDVTIQVDSLGLFGSAAFSTITGRATFDPVGPLPAASAVFLSSLGLRTSSTGPYESLEDGNSLISVTLSVQGTLQQATSSFVIGTFTVSLEQTVTPVFALDGTRTGAKLVQEYVFTNNSTTNQVLDLVRYVDADLLFDGSLLDGGGAIRDASGNMILFETDAGGTGATDTTFVGISNVADQDATSGTFDIDQFLILRNRIFVTGNPLRDAISGDLDGDGFVDDGNEYDVALALRNLLNVAPGGSSTFVANTFFGQRPDTIVSPPGVDLSGQVACDTNGNGLIESNESIPGVTVFIDQDGDRLLDLGEPQTITDSGGFYQFIDLPLRVDQTANVVVQNPPVCAAQVPEIGVTRRSIPTGALSRSLVAVDHNGDGHEDLLVVNELGNDITVLLNNVSTGGFTPGTPIFVGQRPVGISSWQPANSSTPVIAVAAVGTAADKGAILVIENGQVTQTLTAGNGPVSVAVNDLNGDGQPDFVAASFRSGTIVARMSGETTERVIATARSPKSVTAALINDDSFMDLVVVSHGFEGDDSSEIIVLLGDGQGNFSAQRQTITGRGAVDVAVANFDGDLADEIVVGSYGGDVRIFDFANGTLNLLATLTTEVGIEAIAARDINRDGLADLVIANSKAETIEIFINTPTGFVRNQVVRGVASPSDMVIANFDGDGILDIAVTSLYGGVGPNFTLPSAATILGLTVTERAVTFTANQTATADFRLVSVPATPMSVVPEGLREFDIDQNGIVSGRDALLIINSVSRTGRAEGETPPTTRSRKFDVNGDGDVTALDALLVINHISKKARVQRIEGGWFSPELASELEDRQRAIDHFMADFERLF